MIQPGRRSPLIARAKELSKALALFRTPKSGDPVDPSRLAEVTRFLRTCESSKDLEPFLKLLPGSYLRHASRSAAPQLEEIQRRVAPLVRVVPDREELIYVLEWARRLLQMEERGGTTADGPTPQSSSGQSMMGRGRPPRRG